MDWTHTSKSFFSRASCSQLRAVSFRAISCLACQTVLRPRSRLVDFNKFYYNLKVTRGVHEFRNESTGTRARGTKARVLDMLPLDLKMESNPLSEILSFMTNLRDSCKSARQPVNPIFQAQNLGIFFSWSSWSSKTKSIQNVFWNWTLRFQLSFVSYLQWRMVKIM